MPILEHWQHLTPSDWEAFAKAWLAELRGSPLNPESDLPQMAVLMSYAAELDPEWDLGMMVVMMNFTAVADHQWQFIRAAVAHAESDDELGHIAAGPLEHLLGWHGEKFITQVEQQAGADPKFARMLTGAWKYRMSDEVWARVQAIQAGVPDPLSASDGESAIPPRPVNGTGT